MGEELLPYCVAFGGHVTPVCLGGGRARRAHLQNSQAGTKGM